MGVFSLSQSLLGGSLSENGPITFERYGITVLCTKNCLKIHSNSSGHLLKSVTCFDKKSLIKRTLVDSNSPEVIWIFSNTGKFQRYSIESGHLSLVSDAGRKFDDVCIQGDDFYMLFLEESIGWTLAESSRDDFLENKGYTLIRSFEYVPRGFACQKGFVAIAFETNFLVFRKFGAEWKLHLERNLGKISKISIHNSYLAVGDFEGKVFLFKDINSLQTPTIFHWHSQPITAMAWSNDSQYLITGGKEGVVVFWNLQSHKKSFLPRIGDEIISICCSNEGNLIAIQLLNNTVKLFECQNLELKSQIVCLPARLGRTACIHPSINSILVSFPDEINSFIYSIAIRENDIDSHLQALNTFQHNQSFEGGLCKKFYSNKKGDRLMIITTKTQLKNTSSAKAGTAGTSNPSPCLISFWRKKRVEFDWELMNQIIDPHGASIEISDATDIMCDQFLTVSYDGSFRLWFDNDGVYQEGKKFDLPFKVRRNSSIKLSYSKDSSLVAFATMGLIGFLAPSNGILDQYLKLGSFAKINNLKICGRFLLVCTDMSIISFELNTMLKIWEVKTEGMKHLAYHPYSGLAAVAINRNRKSVIVCLFKPNSSYFFQNWQLASPVVCISQLEQQYGPLFVIINANHEISMISETDCNNRIDYEEPLSLGSLRKEFSGGNRYKYQLTRKDRDTLRKPSPSKRILEVLTLQKSCEIKRLYDSCMNVLGI